MRRFAVTDLRQWHQKQGRAPLILRGARQVGKSTLVRLLCAEHSIQLIEVNLEIIKLTSIQSSHFDINALLDEIQLKTNTALTAQSLIFFDEIQESPKLLQLLRYFFEQRPDIAVIAAGSLLEIALRDGDYSFPVGRVEFYHLGPMTFLEFLHACGQTRLAEKLVALEFSDVSHQLCLDYFRKYLYIGGMPRAVLTYVESKSLQGVRQIQSQILQTYVADFPKYHKRANTDRVAKVFQSSPLQIGKKVIYQNFDRESKAREIKKALELLIDMKVLLPCYHCSAGEVPLEAGKNENIFKLYFLDVGLMACMLRIDYELLENEFREGFSTKGILLEQFVAQSINYYDGPQMPPQLSYWIRDKNLQKGEIDFLIQQKNKIIPIEVKASAGARMKSLFYFIKEKGWHHAIRFSFENHAHIVMKHKIGDEVVEAQVHQIPLYAAELVGLMSHVGAGTSAS